MHNANHKDCNCKIQDVVGEAYNVKGENFLSPKNKAIADGFWNAGQSSKLTEGFLDGDIEPFKQGKKGGKKYGK